MGETGRGRDAGDLFSNILIKSDAFLLGLEALAVDRGPLSGEAGAGPNVGVGVTLLELLEGSVCSSTGSRRVDKSSSGKRRDPSVVLIPRPTGSGRGLSARLGPPEAS